MDRAKRYLWLLILPLAFAVYSASFRDFPSIRERHKAYGLADSANFIMLIEDFSLTNVYGNEYNDVSRGEGDIAQKHKVHHVLYVMVASVIYKGLAALFGAVGLSANQAMFSVNALVSCVNIALLYALLRHFNPGNLRMGWFALLYASALSTWIYASAPESWNFMPTMILGFLVLFYMTGTSPLLLSVMVGVFMLSNLFVSSLFIFLVIRFLREGSRGFMKKAALSWTLIMATWATLLTALSMFDAAFRPDHLLHYTIWFKKYLNYQLSVLDPYVWKSVFTNMLVNSFLSNQGDPTMPQEALMYTLRQSYLGAVSTAVYLLLFAIILYRVVLRIKETVSSEGLPGLAGNEDLHFLYFCMTWVIMTFILYPGAGFLYSVTIVPMMVMLFSRFIDLDRPCDKALFYPALALLLINNSVQILRFRDALSAIG